MFGWTGRCVVMSTADGTLSLGCGGFMRTRFVVGIGAVLSWIAYIGLAA
jgi:hypothetical protein